MSSTMTLGSLESKYGTALLDHLDREVTIPILDAPQTQGDLGVLPAAFKRISKQATTPVPPEGTVVIEGQHDHRLLGDGPIFFDRPRGMTMPSIGVLRVPEGSVAWLAHAEHGYLGVAPGDYWISGQREWAGEWRRIAD